jgi:hypothetical protein
VCQKSRSIRVLCTCSRVNILGSIRIKQWVCQIHELEDFNHINEIAAVFGGLRGISFASRLLPLILCQNSAPSSHAIPIKGFSIGVFKSQNSKSQCQKFPQKKVIPQFRSQERTRDGTDRDAGENFRAVTLACPSNSRRSSSSVHDPIRSWWLANPHECQCSPHSKIFGSIPVGTTKFAPITEGLQKIFLLLTNSSIYGYL